MEYRNYKQLVQLIEIFQLYVLFRAQGKRSQGAIEFPASETIDRRLSACVWYWLIASTRISQNL